MTADEVLTFALAFGAFGALGYRSTWRQWRRYQRIAPTFRTPTDRLVLLAFLIISAIVVATMTYFGAITLRAMAGGEPIPELRIISLAFSCSVFLIPTFIEWVIGRVAAARAADPSVKE